MAEHSKEFDDNCDRFLELAGNGWTGGKERLVKVIDEMSEKAIEKEINLLAGVPNMSPSTSEKLNKELERRYRANAQEGKDVGALVYGSPASEAWDKDHWNESISVRAGVSDDGQRILVETDMMGTVAYHMVNLQEEAVRQALIAAGWTPPEEEG